ncbi:MAG: lipoprotein-releasing ABC transporter permease subunit [Endozoicomonadaceae bacterium]|nr:lipoprotein-releasing ABC transporter permease subunit [Endozoicomonadaceae bacterium]
MFRPLALFLGYRYTRTKNTNPFIAFISSMAMLGLSLSVAILIIVMSVMNGFDQQLKTRILGTVPHAILQSENHQIISWMDVMDTLQTIPGIIATAPLTQVTALMSINENTIPMAIHGIDPKFEKKVSQVADSFKIGHWEDLTPSSFNLFLDFSLADKLNIQIGDKVTITLPSANINPLGFFPEIKRFTVIGFFESHNQIDEAIAYTHWQDAGALIKLQTNEVQSLRVKVDDLLNATQIVKQATPKLDPSYFMTDWSQQYSQLFSAVRLEKIMVGLLLSFLIAIAAFNLICTLAMTVNNKKADIAILKTIGCSSKQIMGIFMTQGFIIACTGIIIGLILGLLGATYIDLIFSKIQACLGIQILEANSYWIQYLPSDIQTQDIYTILLISFVLCGLATLYPAWRASKISPADILRDE